MNIITQSEQSDFQLFYSELLNYKMSIGFDELSFDQSLLSSMQELDCKYYDLIWVAHYPSNRGRRPTPHDKCCNDLKQISTDNDTHLRTGQKIGNRYFVVRDLAADGDTTRGLIYYFKAKATHQASSFSLDHHRDTRLVHSFPLQHHLQQERDTFSQHYKDFKVFEGQTKNAFSISELPDDPYSFWTLRYYHESGWNSIAGSYGSEYERLFLPNKDIHLRPGTIEHLMPIEQQLPDCLQDNWKAKPGSLGWERGRGKWYGWTLNANTLMVRFLDRSQPNQMTRWGYQKVYYFVQ